MSSYLQIGAAFIDATEAEAHLMWHAGAARKDIRTRVSDRLHSHWRNLGQTQKPALLTRWAYRYVRWHVLSEACSRDWCAKSSLTVCAPLIGIDQ